MRYVFDFISGHKLPLKHPSVNKITKIATYLYCTPYIEGFNDYYGIAERLEFI
jgi:hypothetical protein